MNEFIIDNDLIPKGKATEDMKNEYKKTWKELVSLFDVNKFKIQFTELYDIIKKNYNGSNDIDIDIFQLSSVGK